MDGYWSSSEQVCRSREKQRHTNIWIIGTAAVISPVDRIGYMGEDVVIPTGADGMGPVSRVMWKELSGRQFGTIPSDWSVIVAES